MARTHGAKVTGFFAAPAPTPLVYGDFMPVGYMPPDQHEALIKKASRHHLGFVETTARAAGVEFNCLSVTSDFPADAIIEAARQQHCDLIFMASHGRRGLSGTRAGQRNAQGAHALQDTGARLPLMLRIGESMIC